MKVNSAGCFPIIKAISDACFFGIERPPDEILRYAFESGTIFTQSFGTVIVGFAILTHEAGQPFLWTIAVLPEARGRGVASDLLREVIAECTNSLGRHLTLTCTVDNPAQKLYFDHGFRVVKILPHYYGEKNGLRMRRVL